MQLTPRTGKVLRNGTSSPPVRDDDSISESSSTDSSIVAPPPNAAAEMADAVASAMVTRFRRFVPSYSSSSSSLHGSLD